MNHVKIQLLFAFFDTLGKVCQKGESALAQVPLDRASPACKNRITKLSCLISSETQVAHFTPQAFQSVKGHHFSLRHKVSAG